MEQGNEVTKMSEKVRKKKTLPKSVRPEEWEKLTKAVLSKDKIAIVSFLLAYGAGLRISEVCRCAKGHFNESFIFIPESKYGVERYVPIPKGWRKEFFKYIPFGNKKTRTIQRKFKKYSLKAGLNPKYSFHSLRHGFATRLVERGVPLNQVQLALGHSNISTTSIYIKASPQDLLKSYEEKF